MSLNTKLSTVIILDVPVAPLYLWANGNAILVNEDVRPKTHGKGIKLRGPLDLRIDHKLSAVEIEGSAHTNVIGKLIE
jgi:hypothetical protein